MRPKQLWGMTLMVPRGFLIPSCQCMFHLACTARSNESPKNGFQHNKRIATDRTNPSVHFRSISPGAPSASLPACSHPTAQPPAGFGRQGKEMQRCPSQPEQNLHQKSPSLMTFDASLQVHGLSCPLLAHRKKFAQRILLTLQQCP